MALVRTAVVMLLLVAGVFADTLPTVLLQKAQIYTGTLSNGTKHAFSIGKDTHQTSMTIYVSIIRTTLFSAETQRIGLCDDVSGPTCELDFDVGAKTSFIAEYYADHYFVIGSNIPQLDVGYAIKWCDKECQDVCPDDCAARGACNLAWGTCQCDSYVPEEVSNAAGTSCAVPTSSSGEGVSITTISIIAVGSCLAVIAVVVIAVHVARRVRKKENGEPLPTKSSSVAESSARSSSVELASPRSDVEAGHTPPPAPSSASASTASSSLRREQTPPPPQQQQQHQRQPSQQAAAVPAAQTQHKQQGSAGTGMQLAYVHAEPSASGVFLVSYDAPAAYGPGGSVLGPYVDPKVNQQQQQQQQPQQATVSSGDASSARRLIPQQQPQQQPSSSPPLRPTAQTPEADEEASWGGES